MEITDEEKKALMDEAIEKAKAEFVKEAKADVEKINNLIADQRKAHEDMLKGKLTEAEFKTFEEKSLEAEKLIKGRVDDIETKMNRLPVETSEKKDEVAEGQAEYKAGFFKYMRSFHGEGRATFDLDEKAIKYIAERKALVSNTSGQILIPEEVESEIYRDLPNLNVIRKYATVRPIKIDRIRKRSLTEVEVGWGKLELGKELVESDVTPAEAWQNVEDMEGLAKIGKDELADTDVALASIIIDSFGRAQARKEETGFAIGTGHTFSQPDGISVDTGIAKVETTANNAIDLNAVLGTIYALPGQYRRGGTFMVSSPTMLAMRKLKDAVNGQYVWQPAAQAGQPASIFGYPIEAQEDLGKPSDANECILGIFGDFKAGYRILDRQGMTIQWLRELYATAGLVGILVSKRVGGAVIRTDAFRLLKLVA